MQSSADYGRLGVNILTEKLNVELPQERDKWLYNLFWRGYMASVADQIPSEFLHPDRKQGVIAWIRGTRLPSRFRRELLQAWGAAVKIDLTGEDYEAVTK